MEVDTDNGLLSQVALGAAVEKAEWPALRADMIARLKTNAHGEFPIPKLSPLSTLPSSEFRVSHRPSLPHDQSSEGTNKENGPAESQSAAQSAQPADAGALPKQIADMLSDIITHLETFPAFPPHTIQRLAELVLRPRAHYRALAAYLHAVDRVVRVTSGTNTYPLPPAIPDMSSMNLNGENSKDPAGSVAWSNPTTAALGTDEALGGALLTPIPWLTRRSPESGSDTPGAQIHSESTETIEGPNGIGSVETVSVSVNGVPSTGHTRGVTQGELLRQEQRMGVVPVSQLSRAHDPLDEDDPILEGEGDEESHNEEEEIPHARGPDEIGVNDTGPQAASSGYHGDSGGLETQQIDVEAAVGRKHEDDEPQSKMDESAEADNAAKSPGAESIGIKREADQELEGETPKKVKEGLKDQNKGSTEHSTASDEADSKKTTSPTEDTKAKGAADTMDLE
ncbi:hypothetical protein BGZ63DRAFT_449553 [Mariannaea sp. PMI_226]|nr:hypothetical protein BGZ63DRAFT_449553 [Mariannaea sp. PMI_226]